MTGCAHAPRNTALELSESVPAPKSISDILQQDQFGSPHNQLVVQGGSITVNGVRLKHTDFDYPITVNSRVEHWIDYFCGRGRPYFQKYLERSEFFIPYIVPVLKQNGLPQDLVYLAMIESGFNNLARSHAKAVGPWQFISATGMRYGLNVNWWIDERRDIEKSTLAAAQYLKDLYQMFQSWELAAAAYNAGEAKVARAVQRFGTRDFWAIARHPFLRQETRDYVPKIIAAALISKNRAQFGFADQKVHPGAGEVIASDGEIVKLVKTDKPLADPEYRQQREADRLDQELDGEWAEDLKSAGAEAESTEAQFVSQEKKSIPLAKSIPIPHVTKSGEVGGEEVAEFEVQSPADLLKIARAAGLSYLTVKSLNPEILRWCTPPHQGAYRVKLPASVKERFLVTYNHSAFPREVEFMTYKVRKGETLSRIAKHFGIKVDPMSDLNRVSAQRPLKNGSQVLLPIPNDRSRSFSSLEIKDPPEKRRKKNGRRLRAHPYRVKQESEQSPPSAES